MPACLCVLRLKPDMFSHLINFDAKLMDEVYEQKYDTVAITNTK